MGIVLRRFVAAAAAAMLVASAACEQWFVAIRRGPGAGGQEGGGGTGGHGGDGAATGGHAGSAGDGEGATSSTSSGSGGDAGEGGSGCTTPKPVGNVEVCGICDDGSGGDESDFPCKCKLCDSLDHKWQAECTATGCTCSYDSDELCSCTFDTPPESCNATESCCPDWPKP